MAHPNPVLKNFLSEHLSVKIPVSGQISGFLPVFIRPLKPPNLKVFLNERALKTAHVV